MKLAYDSQEPVIHVYHCRQLMNISRIEQLLFGMEEESVPYFIEAQDERTAQELGYKAAGSSNLDVGIGVGEDETVVLHYSKLKKEEPLFQISPPYGRAKLRAMGANAARLVKGVPFKCMPDTEETEFEEISEQGMGHLTAVIVKRISDLLKEKGGEGFV